MIVEIEIGLCTHMQGEYSITEPQTQSSVILKFNNIFYQIGHVDLVPFP